MTPVRTYSPREGRQQRADRLANSRKELVAILSLAAKRGEDLLVRLGADILLTAPITIPAGCPSVEVTGRGVAGFVFCADLDAAFVVEGASTALLLSHTSFLGRGGHACVSLLSNSLTPSAFASGIALRNVSVDDVTDLLDPARGWSSISLVDCALAEGDSPMNVRGDGVGGFIVGLSMVGVRGSFNVTAALGCGNFTITACGTAGQTGTADTSTCVAASANMFVGCHFGTRTIRMGDAYLGTFHPLLPTRGISLGPFALSQINTANPTITVGAFSRINLDCGASCSGNIALSDGQVDGQLLVIRATAISAFSTGVIPANTAQNVRLTGTWTPNLLDTLTLIWSVADSNWSELARSAL